jgi:hypothetical protein
MNDSLKNTRTTLSKMDQISSGEESKPVEKESQLNINLGTESTEILGQDMLQQIAFSKTNKKSQLPAPTLSETVKNELEKGSNYGNIVNKNNGIKPTPPNKFGLPNSIFYNPLSNESPLKKSRKLKGKTKPYPKGAEMIGLSPGFKNGRQMTWERMNNDKHLKHNINNLRSRFSRKGKIGPKEAERRRLERDRILKIKLDHRDNIERCDLAFQKFSNKNGIEFSVYVKQEMIGSKKSRIHFFSTVKRAIKLYSLENLEVLRFWFEVIFHTENYDTLEKIFPLTLKKLFEKYWKIRKDAELLLMSYLERRLVVQADIYDGNKSLVFLRYLYDLQILPSIVVREWRNGKMPEKRELQVVPGMRFQDGVLTIARSKVDTFLEWVGVVELEAIDQKLRSRNAKIVNSRSNKVQGPFKGILPKNKKWVNGMQKI